MQPRKQNPPSARATAARFGSLQQKLRSRYVIALNCRGAYLGRNKWGGARYIKYRWPLLFTSRVLAEQAAELLDPFKNKSAIPGRGRIVSYTIERVRLQTPRTSKR